MKPAFETIWSDRFGETADHFRYYAVACNIGQGPKKAIAFRSIESNEFAFAVVDHHFLYKLKSMSVTEIGEDASLFFTNKADALESPYGKVFERALFSLDACLTAADSSEPVKLTFGDVESDLSSRIYYAFPRSLDGEYEDLSDGCSVFKIAACILFVYKMRGELGYEHLMSELSDSEVAELQDFADRHSFYPFDASVVVNNYPFKLAELSVGYEQLRAWVATEDPHSSEDIGSFYVSGNVTSDSEKLVALGLLAPSAGNSLLDIDAGNGEFLGYSALNASAVDLFGMVQDEDDAGIADARAELLGGIARLEDDAFAVDVVVNKFDRVYLSSPAHVPGRRVIAGREDERDAVVSRLSGVAGDELGSGQDTWIFVLRALEHLADGGRAVVRLPQGRVRNKQDASIRKHLVDTGMVQGVVSVPTWSETIYYLILGKNDGDIRFVDATDLYVENWRSKKFTERDAEIAVSRYVDGGMRCADVSADDMAELSWSFDPAVYIATGFDFQNATPLGKIAKKVTRGASVGAKELDELSAFEETGISYLRIGDIVDGRIVDDLPMISSIEERFAKYCVSDGDLLITKSGAPFKVAVAHVAEGQVILATGNLYVVTLDKSVANPSYVAAFLQSKPGIELLNRASTGSSIPSLAASGLKQIKVPLPALSEQAKMAERYEAHLDEIQVLKLKISSTKGKLANLFGEVE